MLLLTSAALVVAGLARRARAKARPVDLSAAVSGFENQLRALAGDHIRVIVLPSIDPAWVWTNASQVDQIVTTLVVNAREAMPDGGMLVIQTGVEMIDEAFARQHPGVEPGEFVTLTVTDTGQGIPPEVLSRIFVPFVTSEGPGKEPAQGLATIHAVVLRAGGCMTVASSPDLGSTFSVFIPKITSP